MYPLLHEYNIIYQKHYYGASFQVGWFEEEELHPVKYKQLEDKLNELIGELNEKLGTYYSSLRPTTCDEVPGEE